MGEMELELEGRVSVLSHSVLFPPVKMHGGVESYSWRNQKVFLPLDASVERERSSCLLFCGDEVGTKGEDEC